MKNPVWISFDLGVNGDYEGMYSWLDNHSAVECGDSFCFVQYASKGDLLEEIKADIAREVELTKKSRIYVVYLSNDGGIKGKFLVGKRKQAPWTGYGSAGQAEVPDELHS